MQMNVSAIVVIRASGSMKMISTISWNNMTSYKMVNQIMLLKTLLWHRTRGLKYLRNRISQRQFLPGEHNLLYLNLCSTENVIARSIKA